MVERQELFYFSIPGTDKKLEIVAEETGPMKRWHHEMTTVFKVGERYFKVCWFCGNTEYQENIYNKQPVEVVPQKEMIEVTRWIEAGTAAKTLCNSL